MSQKSNAPDRSVSTAMPAPDTAVLLVNVGTPQAPATGAVRRYLREFLSDPRMVEIPRLIWWPILYGMILPFRAPRSARAYARVWTDAGSPLLTHSVDLAQALQQKLGPGVRVELAMRYGRPSIAEVVSRLSGVQRLLVLPLYPQYSATTTASAFDAVAAALAAERVIPELRLVNHYYSEPAWQHAVADSITAFQADAGQPERLLFSYHGLPKRNHRLGDPYYDQCLAGTEAIAACLGLAPDQWAVSFQSRLGRAEWLKPYTIELLRQWGRESVGRVQVVCPGFAADCLETLDEIAIENRHAFIAAGGGELQYIPALNACQAHVDALAQICRKHGSDWTVLGTD